MDTANKVVDDLSGKLAHSLNYAMILPRDLCDEFRKLDIEVVSQGFVAALLGSMSIAHKFFHELRSKQKVELKPEKIHKVKLQGRVENFDICADGSLRFMGDGVCLMTLSL